MSCACFTFALVGIPIAIRTGRKETSISFVISLGIAITYYMLVILALALKEKASAYPEVIIWVPNLIFQTAGFFLLWKANKTPF